MNVTGWHRYHPGTKGWFSRGQKPVSMTAAQVPFEVPRAVGLTRNARERRVLLERAAACGSR